MPHNMYFGKKADGHSPKATGGKKRAPGKGPKETAMGHVFQNERKRK